MNDLNVRPGIKCLLVAALLATVSCCGIAQGVYHNQRIFVVPAPGPVTIDGKLDDWDLSGEILTYVVEASMGYQSARTAMMYDHDALYISCRVADPTPMLNRADPTVNPDFGWDGDAFQFRLCLDPALGYPLAIGNYDRTPNEALVHMTLWYYTDRQQPVLHLKYGMDFHDAHGYHKGVVPADLYQAAYLRWPDGKGYTLEYRIPWSTLGAPKPLGAGDMTAGAMQLQWSDATGYHSYGGGWAVDLMAHAGFTYQATNAWGKVIFAEKGHLPKELTQEGVAPVRTLPLKFNFQLPKEQVTSVTLVDAKGDRVRNLIRAESRPGGEVAESWDGLDDAGNVLPPGEYTWKGVYHDLLTTKYVMGVSNSGTPSYNSEDGKGAWGGDWGCPVDVCFSGERGALLWNGSEAGSGLIGIDLTGKKQWGYHIGGSYLATDGDWVFVYLDLEKQLRAYTLRDGKQLNFQRGELWAEPNAGKETRCTGLAWQHGKLYVADAGANEVVEYDAKQGTILRRLSVPAPSWLTNDGEGALYLLSHDTVQRLNLADGTLTCRISDHLDHAQGIAVGADGVIYVSNAGVRHNVSVFSKAGKYLRAIGKRGGRALLPAVVVPGNVSRARAGKWDAQTLLNPRGMAVDPHGRLWVTEDDFTPKRISIWNVKTGKLLEEKFGPCYVSTPITMDPADPTRAYCQNVEWNIDLDKGSWSPRAVMIDARPDVPYFWPHMVMNTVFTARNGKQYMCANTGLDQVRGSFLWVRRGERFVAVAGVISPWATLSWRPGAKDWQDFAKIPWLFWEDRHGDGVVHQEDTRLTKLCAQNPHAVVDAELNFYCTGMYNDLYWQRISPRQILANGVPLYDDNTIVRAQYGKGPSCYTSDLAVNPADGSVLMYAGSDIKFMTQTGIWPITSWTKDGKMSWRYRLGCRWGDMYEFPIPKVGELYGCTRCLGITDGITGYSCYFGQAQLLTTDGVPIGAITRDGRSGVIAHDAFQCEWFSGQLVKLRNNRWYLLGGDQDGRILEVQGLNSLQRFAGKLTITPEESKAAADALVSWTSQQARAQSLVLAHYPAEPNWADIHGVKVVVDANRGFTVKTAYNATDLLLRCEVQSPNELVNSAAEVDKLFKGGNLLDLQLATDPAADAKRATPAPGDLRLLITRRDGKPVAVVYRPKVAGFSGDPILFTSPTGKESFDKIEVWNDIKLDYQKTDTGFTVVVTLPLARLGLTPKPGTVLKMDAGYIFGNTTGNVTAMRAYWSNHSFSSGVTQDVPNESRLEPKEWGNVTVE